MSYASTVLADTPGAYYKLAEAATAGGAIDSSGNGTNGTYTNTGGITLNQTGIPGGAGATACKFDGTSAYIAISTNPATNVGDTWSLEAWVLGTGASNGYIWSGSAQGSWAMYGGATTISLLAANQTFLTTSTISIPQDSAFHHCVGTKTGSTIHVYIDGVDVTGAGTNATTVNGVGANIARLSATANAWFGGTLAQIAGYPTVLTAAKVITHYRVGANLSPANTVAPVASGSSTVGSVVSVTTGTWSDAGSPTFTYQWQRDVAGNGVYSNIASATSSSYTLVTADNTCNVRCRVTDTDVVGATTASSNSILDTSGTVVVGNTSYDNSTAWTLYG